MFLTLLSMRSPFCDVELIGIVLNGIGCKLRDDEYVFLAIEFSRELCCEPLRDPGPSKYYNQNKLII